MIHALCLAPIPPLLLPCARANLAPMEQLIHLFQNIPEQLQLWAADYGSGLYLILGLILFCETGLIVAPILPGDSLLFATGAILAMSLPGLNIYTMGAVMIGAVFLGDNVNYFVGRKLGQSKLFNENSKWLNKKHLDKTRDFYARHGGKTIIMARFVPIVRTYAPFVAGLSSMNYRTYLTYSISGAVVWISSFLALGYFFGNIPQVKSQFHYVILAILVLSVMPIAIEFWRERSKSRAA